MMAGFLFNKMLAAISFSSGLKSRFLLNPSWAATNPGFGAVIEQHQHGYHKKDRIPAVGSDRYCGSAGGNCSLLGYARCQCRAVRRTKQSVPLRILEIHSGDKSCYLQWQSNVRTTQSSTLADTLPSSSRHCAPEIISKWELLHNIHEYHGPVDRLDVHGSRLRADEWKLLPHRGIWKPRLFSF